MIAMEHTDPIAPGFACLFRLDTFGKRQKTRKQLRAESKVNNGGGRNETRPHGTIVSRRHDERVACVEQIRGARIDPTGFAAFEVQKQPGLYSDIPFRRGL